LGTPFFNYPVAGADEAPDDQLFMPDRTEAQWKTLVSHSERRPFRAGEDVVRLGDVDRALLIIVEGTVQALLREGGLRRQAGPVMPAGTVIGEIAFIDGKPRAATVRAVTDGELLRLSWEQFERLARGDPELGRAILYDLTRILAARLRQADEFIRGWLG
jgi:CRP-like cAMP-binding protein